MLKFVALAWETRSSEQTAVAGMLGDRINRDLKRTKVLESSGLTVYCTGLRRDSTTLQPIGERGVLLGTLFRRSDLAGNVAPSQAVVSAGEASAVLADPAGSLPSLFWGRFVAFLKSQDGRATWVYQNPSAGWPVYRGKVNGVWVYFSDLTDFMRLSGRRLSISWDYIAAHAALPVLYTEATAIQGVQELLGGQCDRIDDGQLVTLTCWSPAPFARQRMDEPIRAAGELHRIVDYCARAWASCYPILLHQLSGGVDSSILAVCLTKAEDSRVSTVHYHSGGPRSDEREYAHMTAKAVGLDLAELPGDLAMSFAEFLQISPSPRPSVYLSSAVERTSALLARKLGATGISTGQLGDGVFYQHRDPRIAVDFVHDHGMTWKLRSVVRQAAALSSVSRGRIFLESLAGLTRHYPRLNAVGAAVGFRRLLTPAVVEAACECDGFAHPWVRETEGLPPAKAWHVWMMAQALPARAAMTLDDDAEYVHPLGSQPILELCASIPTYTLTIGGVPRGLARLAFHRDLPTAVLMRQRKSVASAYVDRLTTDNHELLKDWLLGGELVTQGIVAEQPLADMLAGKPSAANPSELLQLASLTAWLNVMRACNDTYRAAA